MLTLIAIFYFASLAHVYTVFLNKEDSLDKFKEEFGKNWVWGVLLAAPAVFGKVLLKAVKNLLTSK